MALKVGGPASQQSVRYEKPTKPPAPAAAQPTHWAGQTRPVERPRAHVVRPNLDGGARQLTVAELQAPATRRPALDTSKLFSPATRQRELAELQRTVGADFGLSFVEVDLNDPKSISAVTEQFARAHVNGSAVDGVTFARGLINNEMLTGENMSPAAALAATGVDPDTGQHVRYAIVAFNSKNNHVMKGAFGDLSRVFGADELKQTEHMTLLHEAAHTVIHHAEQAGMETWSAALGALGSPEGKAGDALRKWAASPDGAVTHPEIRKLLLSEAGTLDTLQAKVRAGAPGLSYNADRIQKAFQDIKSRPDYRNYQENMGDAFMALKLKQEGFDVTKVVGQARAAGHDAEHDTSVGQAAIGTVRGSEVLGMSSRQLMLRTADLVQGALKLK